MVESKVETKTEFMERLYEAFSNALNDSPCMDDVVAADVAVEEALDKLVNDDIANGELWEAIGNATATWSYQGFVWGYAYCVKDLIERGKLII